MASVPGLYTQIDTCYNRLDQLAGADDARLFSEHAAISKWSVAQHVMHTARATAMMLAAVDRISKQKPPAHVGGSITLTGRAVLLSGRFPRGRAQAPARSLPPDSPTREDVAKAVTGSRSIYDQTGLVLDAAERSNWKADHPFLGPLDTSQWLRMAAVHARHHFNIIDDILTAEGHD